MKTMMKNRKRKERLSKSSFKKMVVFIKIAVSFTIVNDEPLLTIVNGVCFQQCGYVCSTNEINKMNCKLNFNQCSTSVAF